MTSSWKISLLAVVGRTFGRASPIPFAYVEWNGVDMPDNEDILEEGSIYFFYRPVVDEDDPHGLVDVQRFYMVLNPDEGGFRLFVIGRKQLPEPEEHGRFWGFVDAVTEGADELKDILGETRYETETRGRRKDPASRPAGEGRYAIFHDGNETRLSYALKLPNERHDVQEELHIEDEATFVLSIKNPDAGSPQNAGLPEGRQADFPKRLKERFDGRRWIGADPPEFLDVEGAEILLIGAHADVADVAENDLKPDQKRKTSEMKRTLHLRKSEFPVAPLFEGEWE